MTEAAVRRAPAPATEVLLAGIPGAAALLVFFGAGVLTNLLSCAAGALAAEAVARRVRGVGPGGIWRDSAAFTGAALLAVSLPPAVPWWIAAAGAALATGVLRRVHDGSGRLLFNPAMAAFALLLLAFPREMSTWPAPGGVLPGAPPGPLQALRAALGTLHAAELDALSRATPLELLRTDTAHTTAELRALHPQFGAVAGRGWEWVNAGFLAGGLWLLHRGIVRWQAPAAMLGALGLLALLNDDGGSSASAGSPLFHLFGGGTMLGAFFILGDPRSGARTPAGRLLAGALAGVLVFTMRAGGAWPDAIAFGVLAGNALAAWVDRIAAPGVGAALPPRARRWPEVARLATLAALTGVGWNAEPRLQQPDALPIEALAGTIDPGARIERFTVQDAERLGLGVPREAARLRRGTRVEGVVLPVVAPEGYAGPIELLVAIGADGRVAGVLVTRHRETPGFADPLDAPDAGWLAAFAGRGLSGTRWELRRAGGDFDGFSGASVTPHAVVVAVREALRYFDENRGALLDGAPADAQAGPP